MKLAPFIRSIYVAPDAGVPMQKVIKAELMAHIGIQGDRYAQGIGTFSKATPIKVRHISLIAEDGIRTANHLLEINHHPQFTGSETRRNIIISQISSEELNQLVGRTFYLGGLALKGIELCDPCQRPAKLLKKPDFINAFSTRGGIRAAILESGTLFSGSELSIPHAHNSPHHPNQLFFNDK